MKPSERGAHSQIASKSSSPCKSSLDVSNFLSNFWRTFGKLWEARSRLYRNESLQVNTRWKALDEIYKIYKLFLIYKLLHRSAFKNSAKFRQTFSHFYNFVFEISLIFRNFCPNLTNVDEFFRNFSKSAGKDQNLLDSQISWDFAPKIVEFFRERLSKS